MKKYIMRPHFLLSRLHLPWKFWGLGFSTIFHVSWFTSQPPSRQVRAVILIQNEANEVAMPTTRHLSQCSGEIYLEAIESQLKSLT